jgi:hypothetical protein
MASELVAKSPEVGIVPTPKTEAQVKAERMAVLEANLLETSLCQMTDALAWNEYTMEELSDEQIELCDEAEAKRRRTAKAANMPAGSAPVGLKLASQFIVGVMKARATSATSATASAPTVVINLPAPVSKEIAEGRPTYEVIELE